MNADELRAAGDRLAALVLTLPCTCDVELAVCERCKAIEAWIAATSQR